MPLSDEKKLFEFYWERIKTNNFLVKDIKELFLSRFSAFQLLASRNEEARNKSKEYLLRTMTQSEIEYNFSAKDNFVRNVESWESPQILAQRSDSSTHAIVYKINYILDGKKETLHEISFFIKDANDYYKYTHTYNLKELADRFCSSNINEMDIRQIGDMTLHKQARSIVDFSGDMLNEINRQISIMKNVLFSTGGVGIAANQCAQLDSPLRIILVGVDYQNPEHVIKAILRYPTALFPQMRIYINPVTVQTSMEENIFPEGCLSVKGTLRALVKRPISVMVRYQNMEGHLQEFVFDGSDARVMLHELDHINNGMVYFQHIIDELTTLQLNQLLLMVEQELPSAINNNEINPFFNPVIAFVRNENGMVVFDGNAVKEAFRGTTSHALKGIYDCLKREINERSQVF